MGLDHDTALKALLSQRVELVGYIRAIVGDRHLAEDVFQEVALAVVRKHAEIADEVHLGGWARTAARFEALAAMRRARRDQPFDDALIDVIDQRWQASEEAAPPNPALAALRVCCERLPPSSQRLVTWRYHENRSGAEMAELLGRPVNTVYVTLSRIHRALTACVREQLARLGEADAV